MEHRSLRGQDPAQVSHLNRSGTGVEWEEEPYPDPREMRMEPRAGAENHSLSYGGYRQHIPQGGGVPEQQVPQITVKPSKERRNDPLQRLLHSLELSSYYPKCVAAEVVYSDLPDLTEEDLAGMGVKLGPRKRMIKVGPRS